MVEAVISEVFCRETESRRLFCSFEATLIAIWTNARRWFSIQLLTGNVNRSTNRLIYLDA